MRIVTISMTLAFSGFGCSVPDRLAMPSPPGPPSTWNQFSASTLPRSNCPEIEGVYLEPPSIYRSEKETSHTPKDNFDLYSGYVPFHLGDRKELSDIEYLMHQEKIKDTQ